MPIFPAPPIRTPFEDKNSGSGISRPWIEWMQTISNQLSTAGTTVTGAKAGNAALGSLISVLAAKGIIKDGTTA